MKYSPGRWQEIADQAAGNNDKALKPHARVHAHAHEKDDKHIPAAPREPEKSRRQAIAEKHAKPPVPPVGAKDAGPKGELFAGLAAMLGDSELHRIGVAHQFALQP